MPMSEALTSLRKQVDVSRYAAGPGAPAWIQALASLAAGNAGALSLIGPPGLSVATETGFRTKTPIEPAALYLAALTDTAATAKLKIGVAAPPSGQHLPLLFAIGTLLSTAINRVGLPQTVERPGPVLVVSPDLELRSRYCDVFIRDIGLDQAYAGTRLLASGIREKLTFRPQAASADGVCFFLPGLSLPSSLGFRPQLVILDLRFSRWTQRLPELVPWVCRLGSPVVALYTLGDADGEQAVTASGFLTFPLDHAALSYLSPPASKSTDQATTDWALARSARFLERRHQVLEIPDCEEVEPIFWACSELLQQAKRADPSDLSRAHWIVTTLRQIAVPLQWYEEVARSLGRSTVKRLISQVGYRSNRLPEVGPILQSLRMLLDSLYQALDQRNPRADFFREQIRSSTQIARGDRVLCVTRDRVSQKALSTWIQLEAFPTGHPAVDVQVESGTTFRHLDNRDFECALINGAFPRRYRWLAGSSLAPRVLFVTYPHESTIVEKQLRYFYDKQQADARSAARAQALRRIHAKLAPWRQRPCAAYVGSRPTGALAAEGF